MDLNFCEKILKLGNVVVCLDNFSTENIVDFFKNLNFKLIESDIRDLDTCRKVADGSDFVLYEAALSSVPRSINDPIVTNNVNISGFLNMLVAARDAKVKRFVYCCKQFYLWCAAKVCLKLEDVIGKPFFPYAVTKYVNELYADVFARIYIA